MMPGESLGTVEHPSYGSTCDLRDYTLPAFLWDEWAKSRRAPLAGVDTIRTSSAADLKRLLSWAINEIHDLSGPMSNDDLDGIPDHDCEFDTNPDKGACAFHQMWGDCIIALASPAEGVDATPSNTGDTL